MNITIKDATAIVPSPFALEDFGPHAEASIGVTAKGAQLCLLSLICVLDLSAEENPGNYLEPCLKPMTLCGDLIPYQQILLKEIKPFGGPETLWRIRFEIELEKRDLTRLMEIELQVATQRPRRKKTRTMAQLSAQGWPL